MADERERLLEIAKKNFPNMEKRFAPGGHGWHELLDRVYIIQNMWEDLVKVHPSACLFPDLFKMADEISDKLAKFYVQVGANEDERSP